MSTGSKVPNLNQIDKVFPVIYQPAVDSLGNFLREMHLAKIENPDDSLDSEISFMFNNEQLIKFKFADGFYRWFRKLFHGRLIEIETFRIHFEKDDSKGNYFLFEGIFSGMVPSRTTPHLDKAPASRRAIEYYLLDYFHPVVLLRRLIMLWLHLKQMGHCGNGSMLLGSSEPRSFWDQKRGQS